MIIVSQNKKDILNFDFIQRISLDREANFLSIIAYQNGNAKEECMWLGSYDTEERAKEVLQELAQNLYIKSNLNITSNCIDLSTKEIYYMPKE